MVPVEAPPLFELDEQVRRLLDRPGDHMRKVMKQKYSTALSMARMRPRYARRIFKSGPAAPLWTLLTAITLQLARYFHFDDRDRQLIGQHRRDYSRPGFAIQLGTVRFLGTFLPEPTEVPANVITNIANQLDIPDTTCLAHYRLRETHWDHAAEITRAYGYHDFHKPREVFRLVRWLYTRAWLSAERPVSSSIWPARLVEARCCCQGSPCWNGSWRASKIARPHTVAPARAVAQCGSTGQP